MKIGIAWFREDEYKELKNLFVDGNGLHETYEQWLQAAENGLDKLRREGHQVVKAYIDLKTFPEWCRTRGLGINSEARRKFAAEYAARGEDS